MHLVTLDKRLDEHMAAIHRLALDGAYHHGLDVSISRFDHTGLPWVTTPINRKRRELQLGTSTPYNILAGKIRALQVTSLVHVKNYGPRLTELHGFLAYEARFGSIASL
jgi:hypothetical protein